MFAAVTACSSGSTSKHDDPPMSRTPPPSTPGPDGPKVYLSNQGGEAAVTVEVVSTEPKIEKGLMYRQHLGLEEGMLFLMPVEKDWSFWMHNTLIPLDMIFIQRDLVVAGVVANAEPQTDTLRTVGKPSVYVLEVNGGWAAQHGVVAGAKVRFENVK
jgi:uncharacterized membrane protein (UPF0127 family)